MREHAVSCLNLEQIQIMSMCRQFADLIQLNVSYKAIQPFGIVLDSLQFLFKTVLKILN